MHAFKNKNNPLHEFLFYVRFDSQLKTLINQNIRENFVQCWCYETSIKNLSLISKHPPPTFANLPPKFQR